MEFIRLWHDNFMHTRRLSKAALPLENKTQIVKPIIYQMLPRLWGNQTENPVKNGSLAENGTGKFENIDTQTFDYLKSLGVTHVWYTGVIRHATSCSEHGCEPSDTSWIKGKAGSPYSITDYFDVNPYLASDPSQRMDEFESLVKRTHHAGLKVLIDFVPNHVARDYGQFSPRPIVNGLDALGHPVLGMTDDKSVHWAEDNDFFYYPGQALRLPVAQQSYEEVPAKASGNCYSAEPGINDWYDTVKINYCDHFSTTWDKMLKAVLFWASLGVDGFRCDMVELVPIEFCKWLIDNAKKLFPQVIFIAEVYRKDAYEKSVHYAGFDYLYDKSGLYDALHDIVHANVSDNAMPPEMWQSTQRITGNWQLLGGLQPRMLNFLENHDEQRLSSKYFAGDARYGLAALTVSLLFNTAPFMFYFGQEIGESGMDEEGLSGLNGRTTIFDWWSVASLRRLYKEIHGGEALTPSESSILDRYRELLKLSSEPVFSEGGTYDLCYCNFSSNGFNKDRHFAFLRNYGTEAVLVVANFGLQPSRIEISIPAHAFDWMGIKESEALNSSKPISLDVPACDSVILRLS